jgi:exodeoxyribonuclease VII large subunit
VPDLFDQPFEDDEDPVGAAPPPLPRRAILTVTELNAAIRAALDRAFGGDIWVEAEISNCKVWNTGHMYFTLKDGGAQVRAVMFRSAVRALRFKPEDGLHVIARGRVGVYEPKGEYQLVCDHLEPHGLGALQLAFDQLKKRLAAEGLFDAERKRQLPALPRKIGIVTSMDGAALRDIVKVLRRRHPNAHLIIRPARVQGDTAAGDLARGLRALGRVPGVDVIICGRGGGSAEDLQAFNQEVVARAIAASPVPVISAVGHEVDVTIADFVADLRAPTPSAAAEMVVAAKEEFCARIDRLAYRLTSAARQAVQHRRAAVHGLLARRGLGGWHAQVAMRGRHAAELTHQLRAGMLARLARQRRVLQAAALRLDARDPRRQFLALRGRLLAGDERLRAAARRTREQAETRFRVLAGRLDTLSPLAVLARGYAVCWNEDRTAALRHAADAPPGTRVYVRLHEGELTCGVIGSSGSSGHRTPGAG